MRQHKAFRAAIGTVAIVAVTLVAVLAPAIPAWAAAGINLSRDFAAPTDRVFVHGFGFQAGDAATVSVNFGGGNQVQASATIGGDGGFTTSFIVPQGAAEGTYRVTAQDTRGDTASRSLTVLPLVFLEAGKAGGTVMVLADHGFFVRGAGFQGGETVKLSADFPLYTGNTTVVGRTVPADGNGNLPEAGFQVPREAKAGTVSFTGVGDKSERKATVPLNIVYRPFIFPDAQTVQPGETMFINGRNFVANTTVRVSMTISRSGATSTLARDAEANGLGAFRTSIDLPGDTSPGTYSTIAVDTTGGFRASTSVTVGAVPPTAGPPPGFGPPSSKPPRRQGFGFEWVSLWYHVVCQGSWDRVVVQGIPHTTLGIWAHVIFANGRHYDWYQNTSGSGLWAKTFSVPHHLTTKYSNLAYVTFQLWHAKDTIKWFMSFTLVCS